VTSPSTAGLRRAPARRATSAPSVTPLTKPAINSAGTSARGTSVPSATPSRVVLPDMNETK
jgi:hypothetical protein